MAIGLGKRYWVRVISHYSGSLEKCIEFMNLHKPSTNKQWFELRPLVKVKDDSCDEYCCDLVQMAK